MWQLALFIVSFIIIYWLFFFRCEGIWICIMPLFFIFIFPSLLDSISRIYITLVIILNTMPRTWTAGFLYTDLVDTEGDCWTQTSLIHSPHYSFNCWSYLILEGHKAIHTNDPVWQLTALSHTKEEYFWIPQLYLNRLLTQNAWKLCVFCWNNLLLIMRYRTRNDRCKDELDDVRRHKLIQKSTAYERKIVFEVSAELPHPCSKILVGLTRLLQSKRYRLTLWCYSW
jgi:hypothetical protein